MKIKKFCFALLALVSLSASAQVLDQKYDSKGNPKAKGVWMVVRYPNGWVATEGVRPGIVQRFNGEYAGVRSQLLLQVRELPNAQNTEPFCQMQTEKQWNEFFTDKESGIVASGAKKIKIEGKPGAVVNLTTHMERAEIGLTMATRLMTVCHKDKFISLSCVASAPGLNIEEAKARLKKLEPMCRMYGRVRYFV